MPQQPTMANSVSENSPAPPELQPSREQIADLARALWEARGSPEGSPEDDWYRAEEQLKARAQAALARS